MRVRRKDFSWAVSRGVISEGQAEDLWRVLERRDTDRPRFDLPHAKRTSGGTSGRPPEMLKC